ncbi:MAG: hypothetical protein QF632_02690, partial [Candidatus Woesearchaeota archaeon]|nr:hypothetical protein [Candidatus Woesearchaeota archaeon]
HEFRHITEGNKVGDFSTDFTLRTFFPFTSNFDLKVRLPKTIDERLRIDLAGVNQNYENARNFWRNTFLRNNGEIVWDQGTSFAIAQSWHSWYHLVDLIDNDNTGDMNNYAKLLNLKGIGLTEKEATLESFFPLLASWHTYQSIFSSIQYMATGEKSVTATTFNVGSLELTPPYFALYLTPEGNFLNTSLLVNPSSDYPLEVSVGNHLDMFGGEVDTFRFGAQLHNITFFEGKSQFRVSPFVYLNTSGELNPKGFSLGTELIKPLTQWAEISVNLGYHQDDILERTIKGKDNGFNATGNLTLRF